MKHDNHFYSSGVIHEENDEDYGTFDHILLNLKKIMYTFEDKESVGSAFYFDGF